MRPEPEFTGEDSRGPGNGTPGSPRKASRFHRLLLKAYPESLRARWGEELCLFWEAQAKEGRYRGPSGRLRLTLRLLFDALYLGMRARITGTGEKTVSRRAPGGRRKMFGSTKQDLGFAFRTLRRAPLFSLVTVATLALGIGATAAVFSVVEAVLLRPLPFPNAHELFLVPRTLEEGKTRTHSWPDFRDYRDQARDFALLAAYCGAEATFEWEGGAQSLHGAGVTREFFQVMGINPLMGRTFTPEEEAAGGPRAVIVSYRFWNDRVGALPELRGITVPMDGEDVPVVGVMPEGFSSPYPDSWFWTPVREDELLAQVGLPTGTRTLHFLEMVARIDGSLGPEGAEGRLRALARSIDQESGKPHELFTDLRLVSLKESLVAETDLTLLLLLAAAGLVLAVASANVAGLSFSRTTARRREIAVRAALGAGKGRILGQLLTESLVLSVGAGATGALLALGAQRSLMALAPEEIRTLASPEFNATYLLFVGGVTVLSGLLFGFFPALQASRSGVSPGLAGGRGAQGGRNALRPHQLLVTAQVSLSVVLMVGAALLLTSLANLQGVDRGFEDETVVLATLAPNPDRYATPESVDDFYRNLLDRVRAMPGVLAASTTYSPPLAGNDFWTTVVAEGADPETADADEAGMVIVRDGYFEANGIPLLRGRDFGPQDRLGEPLVAIVNETMARRLWPGDDPLGKRFFRTRGVRGNAESFDEVFFPGGLYTVVGVSGDIRRIGMAQDPGPEYYRPHSQIAWTFQYLVVRADREADLVASQLRQTVWDLDPTVPVQTVEPLAARVEAALSPDRFRALLLSVFAAMTAFLAMVGLYALMALLVARRSREMGIRMALGAPGKAILRQVLAGGLSLVGIGLALGLAMALASGRLITGMLFQVRPSDPVTYAAVAGTIGMVALAACLLPARRASKLDPVSTLRNE